jgi:mRNA interferase ChpB
MAVFDRGDIVRLNLEPVVGHEMRGDARPALLLTPREFNRLGNVLVAPITQGGDLFRYQGGPCRKWVLAARHKARPS